MKKGILQRVSKNWEENKIEMAPPPEVKQEPPADYPEPVSPVTAMPCEAVRPLEVKKVQRDSMIAIRKDYSHKYTAMRTSPTVPDRPHFSPRVMSPTAVQKLPLLKPRESGKRATILERYDYDKGPSRPKLIKVESTESARAVTPPNVQEEEEEEEDNSKHVPSSPEPEEVKVIVAQKMPVVKQEKPAENINKINNKINIIFQLNDNTKSLRKNIILHRRTPKKMVQKITIKEANNALDDEVAVAPVPERIMCNADTQTEKMTFDMSLTTTCPLMPDEPTEHLFFEDEILISLQRSTISFFELNRLGSLLKKGETDFRLIDRIPRRLHDDLVDVDNKFQRLCFNDQSSLPIYVEMRAKQKELEDPEMCPIAFLYCNVYYVDQKRAKFSSVHLDTVKSVISDIIYCCVPGTSYFIMAWNEVSLELKSLETGIVKYKLTPNLDLAKLASIRQFPKLNYRTTQMYCGKDSQLITFGESQVSIFNYESGDLLMSLDLMKSYGTSLTTFGFNENYLFMVYLADDETSLVKRIIVIGVNKCDGNNFKVVQTSTLKLRHCDSIVSKSITPTNHLLITFSDGSVVMMHLNNFRDIHLHGSHSKESIFAAKNHVLTTIGRNVGLRNFTEFFLN